MGEETAIGWTDHTFNPWWGCERVSPGCNNCYAETFAKRTGNDVWGKKADRRFFGEKHWNEPVRWNKKAAAEERRHRVFCASMADVFEDRRDLDTTRDRLWNLIEDTPWLDWQLLTKRPQNVKRLVKSEWVNGFDVMEMGSDTPVTRINMWPQNCWIGTTVEDQRRADERIPELLGVPAPVLFLSCEPLLGAVDLTTWRILANVGIDWVICGGESGPKHRPLDLDHARSLRDQCADVAIPFFFKQVGGRTPTAGGDLLDGVQHKEFPNVQG